MDNAWHPEWFYTEPQIRKAMKLVRMERQPGVPAVALNRAFDRLCDELGIERLHHPVVVKPGDLVNFVNTSSEYVAVVVNREAYPDELAEFQVPLVITHVLKSDYYKPGDLVHEPESYLRLYGKPVKAT